MATTRARNLQRAVVKETGDALVVASASMMANAIKMSTLELPSVLRTLGQALDLRKMPRERMRETNMRIARQAQRAVVKGWRSRLPAATPDGGPNRLSGSLGPALADPGNLAGTTDRVISFANFEVLGREAKHWYRINYGARGPNLTKSKHTARRFVMLLNGQTFGSFRDELPPDSVSYLPIRFYWRGDSLFPKVPKGANPKSRINPNGARAARFLDLGHSVVAREAPKAYDALWRTYLEEKGGAARQRVKKHEIHVVGDIRFQRTGWDARVRI